MKQITKKYIKVAVLLLVLLTVFHIGSTPSSASSIQPRGIIGQDERTQVTDTTQAPYQSLAFIAADGAAGSGAVIDKNTVLTAAHVVKNIRMNPDKDSIYVIPGRNGSKLPYGKFKIKTVFIPQSYIDNPSVDRDIAVLKIEPFNGKRIGDVVPPLPVKHTTTVTLGDSITVTGYPGDKTWGTMWTDTGKITGQTATRIQYDTDTKGGQSGSAILNDQNEVIGVHTTAAGSYNFGTKLNDTFYAFVKEHMDE